MLEEPRIYHAGAGAIAPSARVHRSAGRSDARDKASSLPALRRARAWWGCALLALAAGTALAPDAPRAQTQPRGSAFAAIDHPGRAQQHCFSDTLEKARSCVVTKCRAASDAGSGAACMVTSACDRSGWAGVVGVKMKSASFTMTMCGVPSRVSLIARLKDLCRSYSARGLEACSLDTVWTPDSGAEATNLVWTPRTLRRPGSAWR